MRVSVRFPTGLSIGFGVRVRIRVRVRVRVRTRGRVRGMAFLRLLALGWTETLGTQCRYLGRSGRRRLVQKAGLTSRRGRVSAEGSLRSMCLMGPIRV